MRSSFDKRVRPVVLLLVLLGIATGGIAPAALADGAEVSNFGSCVTHGVDPTTGAAFPMTIVANSSGVQFEIPHQSVDGFPPPPFDGAGWWACPHP
jgi:hypothetical protein